MEHIEYKIKPTYLKTENGMRKFQKEMKYFVNNDDKHNILVLKAPTGSGKTFGFYNLNDTGNVLIIMPNNELVNQTYNDLQKLGKKVQKITADELDKIENEENINRRRAFNSIINSPISGNYFVVTNPEILLRLIINKYIISEKIDEISVLKQSGFNVIIFDEFHIYNTQQLKEISAIIYILHRAFKIILASATPKTYFLKALKKLINEKIIEYDVKRESSGELIQGPLDVKIYTKRDMEIFIDENMDLIKDKNKKWLFIIDKIINIENIYKKIIDNGIKPDEISLFDSYHNEKVWKRITLSSNILEQGINISDNIYNFVIEKGMSARNLEQRLGRVGRGCTSLSNVYIILGSISESHFDVNINTYNDLIESFYNLYPPNDDKDFNLYSFGIQLGKICENLSYLMRINIYKNYICQYKDLKNGYLNFVYINDILINNNKNIINNRIFKKLNSWWEGYKSTMENFINGDNKQEIKDESLIGKDIEAKYSEIWIKRFKETYENRVITNREKPLNVSIKVRGIPFEDRYINYNDLYQARRKIIESSKEELYELVKNNLIRNINFKGILEHLIQSTADKERLKIISIDE